MRARGFTQDDAHIFCTIEQLDAELENLLNFSINMLSVFGFNEIEADLSTKPSKASRKVISEETQVADRFRKLAGLIK